MKDTISEFARECSQASRIIVRHPRFFLITVLVLSLGIGMSTALFSVMYGVLLKPLPVQEQDHVVVAWKGDPKDVAHISELSYPEFQDWQRQSKAFAMMAAMPTTVYGTGSLSWVMESLSNSKGPPLVLRSFRRWEHSQ